MRNLFENTLTIPGSFPGLRNSRNFPEEFPEFPNTLTIHGISGSPNGHDAITIPLP